MTLRENYFENDCAVISVDGSPGTRKPLNQSLVVVAAVLVALCDQTNAEEEAVVEACDSVFALLNGRSHDASPTSATWNESPVVTPVRFPTKRKYLDSPAGTLIASMPGLVESFATGSKKIDTRELVAVVA